MKYFIHYKRNGLEVHCELVGSETAVEALGMATGFVEAATRRSEPFEFLSVYAKPST